MVLAAELADDKEHEHLVEITIRDQGRGIPTEMQERIFESFFTSKADDDTPKGLGLGLSVVRSIVESHGGSIDAGKHTRTGNGFPCVSPSQPESGGTVKWTALDRSCWSTTRRPSVSRPAGCCGVRASIATAPAMATKRVQALQGRRFDVMIADIRMPGNPDLRVVQAAKDLDSQMPVILVTGYPSARDGNPRHRPVGRGLPDQAPGLRRAARARQDGDRPLLEPAGTLGGSRAFAELPGRVGDGALQADSPAR